MALEGRAARRLEQRLHQPDPCHLSSGTVFRMIFSGCAESLFVETPSKGDIQSTVHSLAGRDSHYNLEINSKCM